MKNLFRKRTKFLGALALGAALFAGCGDGEDFIFTSTNIQVAPVAVNDTIVALGNATLNQEVANGVLVNDTPNGATISAFDAASTQGGTVAVAADGSFTYTPLFGFTGVDTFTYTLTNNAGSSTGTVTMNVNNSGWFVDNSGANGNGSQATPFNNLPDALAQAGNGDTVFVFFGDGTSTNQDGAIALPAGVNLVGEGQGLILAQTVVAQGNAPTIEGPIMPAGGNGIFGFNIDADPGVTAIEASGITDLTISNNTFRTNDELYIFLDNVAGTANLLGNTFEPIDDDEDYVQIDNNNVNVTYNIDDNVLTCDGVNDPSDGFDIDVMGTSQATFNMNRNRFTSPDLLGTFIEDGITLDVTGNGTATISVNDNVFTNVETGMDFDANSANSTVTGTIARNDVDNTTDNGIEADASGGTVNLTVTGNTVDNSQEGGIDIDADVAGGDLTLVATGNTVNNTTGDNGMEVEIEQGSTATVALRDNTVTNSASFSISVVVFNASSGCFDITGNIVNDQFQIDAGAAGTLDVERFTAPTGGPLSSANTFNAPVVPGNEVVDNGAITARDPGFCNLP